MPVTKPTPGAVIAAADVTGMHATVRSLINDLLVPNIGRHALGAHSVPGFLLTSDTTEVTAAATVTTSPVAFVDNDTANFATWQDMTTYYVDNAGAGYVLATGFLIYWCSLEIASFASTPDVDHQCWFNLYYRTGGTNQYRIGNSRPMWGEVLGGGSASTALDHVITIVDWQVISAVTLNRIGVLAAKNRGGSGAGVPDVSIRNGTTGFLHLYPYV